MGVAASQLFALMGREIDDEYTPARLEQARGLTDRCFGLLRIVKQLVKHHRVGAARFEGQCVNVALPQISLVEPSRRELGTCEPEHLGAAVDADSLFGRTAQQFEHPAGASAEIDKAAQRRRPEHLDNRGLDCAFRYVERANRIPLLGVGSEIGLGGRLAIGTDRSQMGNVGARPILVFRPGINRLENRPRTPFGSQPEKHPAALLAPHREACIGENPHMSRDTRLALAEHLRQLADRKLHCAEQPENAKTGRIGERAEDGKRDLHVGIGHKEIFICRQRPCFAGPMHATCAVSKENVMRPVAALAGLALLAGCATLPEDRGIERDRLEGFNRGMWAVNDAIDRAALKPATKAYRTVAPRPARRGLSRVLLNLAEPWSAINNLLQGKPKRAARNVGRFLVNATIGVGGLADHASGLGIAPADEDLGQTLASWGIESGPYLILPLLGPSSLRDGLGATAFFLADPYKLAVRNSGMSGTAQAGLTTFEIVNIRSDLIDSGVDAFLATSLDPYAATRSAFAQRRRAQIRDLENRPADEMTDDFPTDEFEVLDDYSDTETPEVNENSVENEKIRAQ